ncbi:hypothetical protein PFISCL1PPCAC_22417, partial [Pristionchus fissidentatus]
GTGQCDGCLLVSLFLISHSFFDSLLFTDPFLDCSSSEMSVTFWKSVFFFLFLIDLFVSVDAFFEIILELSPYLSTWLSGSAPVLETPDAVLLVSPVTAVFSLDFEVIVDWLFFS